MYICVEMAESNGELLAGEVSATKSEDRGEGGERTEDYSKLLEYGLDKKVSPCTSLNVSPTHCLTLIYFRWPASWMIFTKLENWHI